MCVGAFGRGEDDENGLFDIDKPSTSILGCTDGGLSVSGGDVGIKSGRRHTPIAKIHRGGLFIEFKDKSENHSMLNRTT